VRMARGAWIKLLAICFAALMIFARLGQLPLRDPDEGRNAEVAREMLVNDAWLTPTYNGLVYLDKPAFFFRTVALSFTIFGETEFAGRLPSALAACGILLMVYRFCRREYDEHTAALAILIVASTPLFFGLARQVMIDMTLAFFVCAAVFAGYNAEQHEGRRRRNWYLLSAACGGAATLLKGPVGLLIPILTLVAFNIAQKNSGWARRLFHPLNALVVSIIVAPWFIAMLHAHPDFARYGLIEESFHRFTTKSFSRTAPFYFYGLVVLGGLFAWSLLLPGAVREAWKQRFALKPANRLLIAWAAAVVIFFTLSKSKLPHYILTAVIALAILTARVFAKALKNPSGSAARVVFGGLTATTTICLGVAIFLIPSVSAHFLKKTTDEFDRVALTFGPAMALLIVLALIAGFARLTCNIQVGFAAFLVVPLSLITVAFPAVTKYSEASSSRELASFLEDLPEGTEVAGLQSFAPGLPFYLKQNVTLITANGAELSNYIVYELARTNVWPAHIVHYADREKWLASRTNAVCLIAKGGAVRELHRIAEARELRVQRLTQVWSAILIPRSEDEYSSFTHRRRRHTQPTSGHVGYQRAP
jgi:4-amino-4-deoxy-L-arabinose transferase-like glycosyltransferase